MATFFRVIFDEESIGDGLEAQKFNSSGWVFSVEVATALTDAPFTILAALLIDFHTIY